ncbi:hypothetical protein ACHQM5_015956 [Ranunculus cassubicifolius]
MELKRIPVTGVRISGARSRNCTRGNLLDSLEQIHRGNIVSYKDKDGTVKIKIVIKKKDLKHMLEIIGGDNNANKLSTAITPERRPRTAENVKRWRSSWRPALQSIPEEWSDIKPNSALICQ